MAPEVGISNAFNGDEVGSRTGDGVGASLGLPLGTELRDSLNGVGEERRVSFQV